MDESGSLKTVDKLSRQVVALQAIIKQMGEQAAKLAKDCMAAKAQAEALQRERDEAIATALKEGIRSGELQADLDAERERYELLNVERNAIDDQRHVLLEQLANTIEAAAQQEGELAEIQALVADLKSQLPQLQALVRALQKLYDAECLGMVDA